ncbi:MAG TPA: 30S ribosome-binding factor RbfA [Nitrospirae bacterium]|nr:30S ribosome-binding factor RbfA [Nitrospirota bacterium]
MHPYKRSKRVGDLLREEIADIIMRRVKDPRVGFVTVTSVKVTDDLRMARVYITVLHKEETTETLSALASASGFIRAELAKRLRIKILPKLEFHEDESIEYGERIDQLIKKVKEESGEDT